MIDPGDELWTGKRIATVRTLAEANIALKEPNICVRNKIEIENRRRLQPWFQFPADTTQHQALVERQPLVVSSLEMRPHVVCLTCPKSNERIRTSVIMFLGCYR